MKKILTIIIALFLFMNNVNAIDIETELQTLKEKYDSLSNQTNNMDNKILNKTYPIGSIYITTIYSTASEVSEAIGGTWERYSNGKTLVGVDEEDTDFNTIGKIGGTSEITLTTANLPSHSHTIPSLTGTTSENGMHNHVIPAFTATTESNGAHTHTRGTMDIKGSIQSLGGSEPKFGLPTGAFYPYVTVDYYSQTTNVTLTSGSHRYDGFSFQASKNWTGETSSNGAHTHNVTIDENKTEENGNHSHEFTTTASNTESTGSGTSFTNLQPYITVYMYKRVA